MLLPSAETIKRALVRAVTAFLIGAAGGFTMLPVNLDEPKTYLLALGVGMIAGGLQGLQKLISGMIKYDK